MPQFHDGQRVLYQPIGGSPEPGVITHAYVSPTTSRVRFGDDLATWLTDHRDLDVEQVAEGIVLQAAQNALAAAHEVTRMLDDLMAAVDTGPGTPIDKNGPWLAGVNHRAQIAQLTLRLDEAIRETLPLLTWAEGGQAITMSVPTPAPAAEQVRHG